MIDPLDELAGDGAWFDYRPASDRALPPRLFAAHMEAKLRMLAELHAEIMKTLAEIDDLDSFTF